MSHDVVIVGAGPVGLFLAIELWTAGVKPLVIERLAEPDPTIKAGGLGTVGAEALERRGLGPAMDEAERALAAALMPGVTQSGAAPMKKIGGHFAGLFFIDQTQQVDPHRRLRGVNQQGLESLLGARAKELGIEVRRRVSLERFEQDADGVRVWLEGQPEPLRTKYLVGCDGGRSKVRKLAGFEFPGTDPVVTGYQAIVDLDAPDKLLPLGWRRTPVGMMAYGPVAGRILTVEFGGPPENRDAPITIPELEGALQRVSGTDVKITAIKTATRWTDNARQASTYRLGRVLLAGDAAHIHSPFGGQGLNLGLVDAANLGWKLAAVLHGTKPALLDTYTAERHPVGARVLDATRAQVALMRPDAHTGALRNIVAELMQIPDGTRYFGAMMRGVSTRYDLGDENPLVGTLVADRPIGDTTLYALMQRGGGLFVAPHDHPTLPKSVHYARSPDGPAMLVRPDGCIAWTDASTTSLDDALARWFA